jgi:hypothetical protein
MKFAAPILLSLFAPVAIASPDDYPSTAVVIQVQCKGISFDTASISQIALAGRILQDTFNQVHMDNDSNDDDKELAHVEFSRRDAETTNDLGRGYRWGGWSGDVSCRLCKNDDDMLLSTAMLQGSANKAWEAAFVAGLLTTPSFSMVTSCDIRMKPSPDFLQIPNVDIALQCQGGPDLTNLNVAQATLVSHALQASYNTVHSELDDGDAVLEQVFFHAGTNGGLYAATTDLGRGYRWGGWSGDVSCRLCKNDDDAAMLVGQSGAALKAWENEFVVALLQSANTDFHTVKSCSIKLSTHKKMDEEEQFLVLPEAPQMLAAVSADATTHVKIKVNCNGFDFKKLSIADDIFMGNVLQDSYNAVHEEEDDDAELTNMIYDGIAGVSVSTATDASLQRGYRWGGWSGDVSCRLCKNDDDAALTLKSSGAALMLWQDQLVVALLESGRPAFAKVSSCQIKMKATMSASSTSMIKRGLRAVAPQ